MNKSLLKQSASSRFPATKFFFDLAVGEVPLRYSDRIRKGIGCSVSLLAAAMISGCASGPQTTNPQEASPQGDAASGWDEEDLNEDLNVIKAQEPYVGRPAR